MRSSPELQPMVDADRDELRARVAQLETAGLALGRVLCDCELNTPKGLRVWDEFRAVLDGNATPTDR